MQYFIKSGNPEKQRVACVIVGIFDRRNPTEAAQAIDRASKGVIAGVMRKGDMDGRIGQTLVLHNVSGTFCDRVMLVGLGRERDFNENEYRKAHNVAANALAATGSIDAVNCITRIPVKGHSLQWNVQQGALASEEAFYRFDECRGKKNQSALQNRKLERLTFDVSRRSDLPTGERGLIEGLAIARGVKLAKDLANLPGNICTPGYLAQQGQDLAKAYPIKTKVLEEAQLRELGMNALLSVSRGSRQPPKLIVMEYMQGARNDQPIVFVGKGITFDAGGISIKPAAKLDEMKFDMCGAASVMGVLAAAAEMQLPLNIVGVVPASENLPDGDAVKPGDIVTTMAGFTVEILNTDAEGRLVLCDALTYVEKNYQPSVCIDIATLTGACVVALGHHASGLFSNQANLTRRLLAAGEQVGDRAWELPLWEEYQAQLKSEFADFSNIGGRDGGSITAASFLHRFTRKLHWAHFDIAGTAWKGKAATGRPVPLLAQYLLNFAASKQGGLKIRSSETG